MNCNIIVAFCFLRCTHSYGAQDEQLGLFKNITTFRKTESMAHCKIYVNSQGLLVF